MKVNSRILIAAAVTLGVSACKKQEGCTDPTATNYDSGAETDDGSCVYPEEETYNVPNTYTFEDANGNNTVSFEGQKIRLEMLEEMTNYMKTGNTQGTTLDANQLKNMYANTGYTWTDAPSLGMNGSSKQLKNKTAGGDVTITQMFEGYMDSIADVSMSSTAGSAGVDGVVTSNDGTKQYLQDAKGREYTQYIEKGLMGAAFYYQISVHYLGSAQMNVDNTNAVDPSNGKYYTQMEHHWDEAYGYFTSATDYPTNGTDRFWGKYANGRESLLSSATKIAEAFRKGRAAISNDDMATRDDQIEIIRTELEKVSAATAIHYLNSALDNMTDDARRNHALSEAVAFLTDLQYGQQPGITNTEIDNILNMIGDDFYNTTVNGLTNARDEISTIFGMDDIKDVL